MLYLITILKKKTAGIYDYSTKMTRTDILNMNVSLPITTDGNIDFNFMEERIRELSAYLTVSGLDNYKLSKKEQESLKKYNSGKITYKKFKLSVRMIKAMKPDRQHCP